MKRNRTLALALAIAVAFVLLASCAFMIHNAEHDCCGTDDCLICEQISFCMEHLKTFSAAVMAVILSVALYESARGPIMPAKTDAAPVSLVALKVKLSN